MYDGLKTLFNIVEARFIQFLNFDVCVVWQFSDGPMNSHEYKSFEIDQDIYDWISPLNKLSGLPFILTQQMLAQNKSCYYISQNFYNWILHNQNFAVLTRTVIMKT